MEKLLRKFKNILPSKIKTDASPESPRSEDQNPHHFEQSIPRRLYPKVRIDKSSKKHNPKNHQYKEDKGKHEKSNGSSVICQAVFNNCPGIHFGDNHTTNNFTNVTSQNVSSTPTDTSGPKTAPTEQTTSTKAPKIVLDAFENIEMADERDFDIVKTYVNDWKELRKRLCPHRTNEPKVAGKSNHSEKEVILLILQDWSQTFGRYATVGILCRDLWEISEFKTAKELASAHTKEDHF